LDNLKKLIHSSEYNNEFSQKLLSFENYFTDIYKVCKNSFERGCGSYLFDGQNYKYQIETYQKQKLLYEKSKNKENILEIGTYMGHSLLIILMANPAAKITSIDIDDKYSLPVIKYLQKEFPNSKINFLKGNSLNVLKNLKEKYDLIHIDGAHKNKIVTKEFYYCMNLTRQTIAEFIFDDKDNIQPLTNNIVNGFKIIDYIYPKCIHGNLYMKILFPKNKIIFIYKKLIFKLKNNLDYFFSKIIKLLKLKRI